MPMSQLQDEKSKVKSIIRCSRRKQNPTRLYKVVALNCVTVDDKKNPYFFLFSDIDDKDPYHLSRIIKFFAKNGLSFFWYETSKGYHVVSPCLLEIEEWIKLRKGLHLIEDGYYEGLNIRITPKNKERRKINYEMQYKDKDTKISIECMNCFKEPDCLTQVFVGPSFIHTKIQIKIYKEIEINGVQY